MKRILLIHNTTLLFVKRFAEMAKESATRPVTMGLLTTRDAVMTPLPVLLNAN